MRKTQLGKTLVTEKGLPYIIAEIGVSHEGSIELAKKLIELAKEGGANAAKFQSYKAETLASKNSPAYWDLSKEKTKSQFELFKKYDSFNEDDYKTLCVHCEKIGIDFISTPFDDSAVEFLDPLMLYYKVASADLNNIPFLRKIAAKKKPVVLSTGCSTDDEIALAVSTLEKGGASDVVLLHCVLSYPTKDEDACLSMIRGLKNAYPKKIIGYSDHTIPDNCMTTLTSAYLLGAVVIEKHFTHDKALPGNDHYHAMDVNDLKRFVEQSRKVRILLGETEKKAPVSSEQAARLNARRSIVVIRDLMPGDIISEDDITYKRPGTGIGPEHWDKIVGRKVLQPIECDQLLQWNDIGE